jgi:hypothetical protein
LLIGSSDDKAFKKFLPTGRDIPDRPGLPTTHAWQDETEHCHGTEEVDLELRSIILLALLLDGAEKSMPALFTRTSMPPKRPSACTIAAARSSYLVTSSVRANPVSG